MIVSNFTREIKGYPRICLTGVGVVNGFQGGIGMDGKGGEIYHVIVCLEVGRHFRYRIRETLQGGSVADKRLII